MKRRKNPLAPWRWQYEGAGHTWFDDIRDAEFSWGEDTNGRPDHNDNDERRESA